MITDKGHTVPIDEIKNALTLLFQSGDVVELRALVAGRKEVTSGYYNDFDKLAQDAAQLDARGRMSGIYVTLNRPAPALLARRANRYDVGGETTHDHEIAHRTHLFFDVDAKRPSGISSTDEQHEYAIQKGEAIRTWLRELNWPGSVLFDSGNGAGIVYDIDLPNTPESTELVKRVLEAVDMVKSDGKAHIDTSVHNAARIFKLPGTMARKGDSTPDMPHRRSRIITADEDRAVVPLERLQEIARLPDLIAPDVPTNTTAGKAFDVREFIIRHKIGVRVEKQFKYGTMFVLDECPFCGHEESRITQNCNGAVGFGCFHNSCQGYKWVELREKFEPGYKDRKTENHGEEAIRRAKDEQAQAQQHKEAKIEADARATSPTTGRIIPIEPKVASSKSGRRGREDSKAKSEHIKLIVAMAKASAEFYRNTQGEPFVTFIQDGHKENHPLESNAFRMWLRLLVFHHLENIDLSADKLRQIVDILAGEIDANARYYLNLRVNGIVEDGQLTEIYFDPGWSDWRAIKVTANGWEIVSDPPRMFYRRPTMKPLPMPAPAGQGDIGLLTKYFRFKGPKNVGIEEAERYARQEQESNMLVACFTVSAFVPHVPGYEVAYPLLCLIGEPGAAKTTTCKVIKRLVDPEDTEALTMPTGEDRMIETLSHRHMPFFDNCRELNPYQSDRLCKTSYGEAMEKRRHYTNDESFTYRFTRPVLLNGVEAVITRPDLMDRAISLDLAKIESDIKTDSEFWTGFNADSPKILAGILDTLSKAMAIRPTVKPGKVFRMAEFTYWSYAIAEVIRPGSGPAFITAYARIRDEQNIQICGADIVATAVKYLLKEVPAGWEGTPSELAVELDRITRDELNIRYKPDDYPKTAAALSKRLLNSLRQVLLSDGVEVKAIRVHEGRKISIRTVKVGGQCSVTAA